MLIPESIIISVIVTGMVLAFISAVCSLKALENGNTKKYRLFFNQMLLGAVIWIIGIGMFVWDIQVMTKVL